MGISLFFFLFMRLFAEIRGSQDDECKASRCSHHDGSVIKFPFRLKHQPGYCGYPEFELSCSEKNQTILEMPYSGKLWVTEIDYIYQGIVVRYLDDCLQGQILNFNLSASPFQFRDEYNSIHNFSFFNCSENKAESYELRSIPCSFLSSNPVFVAPSDYLLGGVDLSSCRKIFNATLPDYIYDRESDISMYWSIPMCGNCEAKGKKCQRRKNDSREPEIECIENPKEKTY